MRIKDTHPQFDAQPALFAVLGKEKGILYLAYKGSIERVATVEEPAAEYSDREGFFMSSGNGMFYGAGEPYDGNEVQSRAHFIDKVVHELRRHIDEHKVHLVYLYEPEHLKNGITDVLDRETNNVTIITVAYGTFLNESPTDLLERLVKSEYYSQPDPSDPSSVKDSPNADEKRRILEIGKKVSG